MKSWMRDSKEWPNIGVEHTSFRVMHVTSCVNRWYGMKIIHSWCSVLWMIVWKAENERIGETTTATLCATDSRKSKRRIDEKSEWISDFDHFLPFSFFSIRELEYWFSLFPSNSFNSRKTNAEPDVYQQHLVHSCLKVHLFSGIYFVIVCVKEVAFKDQLWLRMHLAILLLVINCSVWGELFQLLVNFSFFFIPSLYIRCWGNRGWNRNRNWNWDWSGSHRNPGSRKTTIRNRLQVMCDLSRRCLFPYSEIWWLLLLPTGKEAFERNLFQGYCYLCPGKWTQSAESEPTGMFQSKSGYWSVRMSYDFHFLRWLSWPEINERLALKECSTWGDNVFSFPLCLLSASLFHTVFSF